MKKAPATARSQPARLRSGQPADGETIAIKALGFLGADPERLERFLSLSGLTATSLRRAAEGPTFSAAILDYLMGDETVLLAFAAQEGFAPERIAHALQEVHRKAGGTPTLD